MPIRKTFDCCLLIRHRQTPHMICQQRSRQIAVMQPISSCQLAVTHQNFADQQMLIISFRQNVQPEALCDGETPTHLKILSVRDLPISNIGVANQQFFQILSFLFHQVQKSSHQCALGVQEQVDFVPGAVTWKPDRRRIYQAKSEKLPIRNQKV